MNNKIENIPNASTLINSMRSIGYDFETAVADIVDNSITAQCQEININFPISTKSSKYLQIVDDGIGMNRNELIEAMRFGSVKHDLRSAHDLGRFGLGLKTASISQCRKFSLISKKDGEINGFYWDLDKIGLENSWDMFEMSSNEIQESIPNIGDYIDLQSFTIVYWENFDTIQMDIDIFNTFDDIYMKKIESTEKHLSLVFHRYLEEGIIININKSPLKYVDPFLKKHAKTTIKPAQQINTKTSSNVNEKVEMQVFILPYYKDLNEEDLKLLGGDTETDNQGFYIYRNKRLMIHGTWFRMKPKAELSRNARIRVDIPNTLDDLWAIDIKKQKARIPGSLMIQLKNEVTDAVTKSKRLHKYKGSEQTITGSIWSRVEDKRDGYIYFKIDEESHLLKSMIAEFDDTSLQKLRKIFKLIQLSIPYRDIYNSVAEKKEINRLNDDDIDDLLEDAIKMFKMFKMTTNLNSEAIINMICKYEPYLSSNIRERLMVKVNDL